MKLEIKGCLLLAGVGLLSGLAGTASAQSATQIYGVLDLWAGGAKSSGAGPSVGSVNSGGMQTSYWGIAGSEDLGGGLKTIYALEGYVQLDTGAAGRSSTDAMYARNAFVGLSGAAGEVKFGRLLSPLFVATAQTSPFGASIRFGPLLAQLWSVPFGRTISGDTSWDNTIAYTTPTVDGFKLASYLGLGETAFGTGTNNINETLSYKGGPLLVTLTAQRSKVGPGLAQIGRSDQDTYFAGAVYDFNVVKLFATYDTANSMQPDYKAKTAQLGATVPVGLGNVMLSWAQTKNAAAGTPDTHRNTGAVGYDYFLSARTDVYAVAQYDKLSTANGASTFGIGIKHKF